LVNKIFLYLLHNFKANSKFNKLKNSLLDEASHEICSQEVTDQSLEKRLKSLRSFVNNLEPKSIEKHEEPIEQHTTIVESTAPPLSENVLETNSTSTSTAYYDMVSEQARRKLEDAHFLPGDAFAQLNTQLNALKNVNDEEKVTASAPPPSIVPLMTIDSESETQPPLSIQRHNYHHYEMVNQTTVVDYNLEKIKQLNQLNYPRLAWNKISQNQASTQQLNDEPLLAESTQSDFQLVSEMLIEKNAQINVELMRFFDADQLCKDLECYYKCKQIQNENFDVTLNDFIKTHSVLSEFQFENTNAKSGGVCSYRNHEFFELCKDYYEARQLVSKCVRYMLEFKWQFIANQMRTIWSFEKYTIESTGMCGDQQQCKHELTSEKAYLNKLEVAKLQTMFYELRFNLIKSGLVSSQFCSKLAKYKIESYLHDFLLKFKSKNEFIVTKTGLKINDVDTIHSVNHELKTLIDILIYFNRKHCKPSFKVFQKREK
jgi:hypothetical protein